MLLNVNIPRVVKCSLEQEGTLANHDSPHFYKLNKYMNAYKLRFENEQERIVFAETSLEVIKKYDLATAKHINTRIIKLEGEQKAIAFSNLE